MALDLLYRYAQNVPNEKIFPVFEKYWQAYGTAADDEHKRWAAVAILGYTSDSDALLDPIKDKIDAYTNFLVDRMNDASLHVREAAGETVGRFTENFHDDFLDMHAKVMPCLLKVIRDLSGSGKDLPI